MFGASYEIRTRPSTLARSRATTNTKNAFNLVGSVGYDPTSFPLRAVTLPIELRTYCLVSPRGYAPRSSGLQPDAFTRLA